jgi:hypothetical protein
VQRAEFLAAQDRALGRLGLLPGSRIVASSNSIDSRIDAGDAVDRGLQHLHRRDLLAADAPAQFHGTQGGKIANLVHAVAPGEFPPLPLLARSVTAARAKGNCRLPAAAKDGARVA